jgi:hypothetical protein
MRISAHLKRQAQQSHGAPPRIKSADDTEGLFWWLIDQLDLYEAHSVWLKDMVLNLKQVGAQQVSVDLQGALASLKTSIASYRNALRPVFKTIDPDRHMR